ncbi:MAG: folate family ECF transporter S component [Acidaminococcus sp.]|jgi:ECF transporter S component (folate family)|nr:folate family ECF transporter S component [Acidaminococcus sp.]MCI2101108.1 folate family ECF transporter S component [Acidaminococcus sp.]MCI2115505.1 folate family ECF transporter S component [Acidaminococcus sp.]MCI2117637.1 folate family ECF transporter S component [Acidaminococcus sp.]
MKTKGQNRMRPVQWITMIGFCVAMEIILARFLSLRTWNLKIGLSFLPVAAAALIGGPLAGGLTGALGDLIGATLFPVGPYFPGFTLSSFLDGALYGICLKRGVTRKNILIAVLLTQIGISLLLNTFWLTVLFHTSFQILLWPRLFQCGVGIVVKTIVLWIVLPQMEKHLKNQWATRQ